MQTKHTPGQWKVTNPVADNSGTFGAMIIPIYADNGTHIYDKRILNKYYEEHNANAKLIAAAPDLLQAAIIARDELAKHIVFMDNPELIGVINDAINKATK